MQLMRIFRNITFVLFSLAMLSSCMPEKELAKQFIQMPEKIRLQIFPPSYIYKYNHKGEKIKGFAKMTESQQDSVLFASSEYVQYVDDSIYLERYVNSFILEDPTQAYVLNMAQLQLDEYIYPYKESQVIGDTTYAADFDLNSVDASTWFELSKVNGGKDKKTVLFHTATASDAYEGSFYLNPFSLDVHLRYTIDTLKVNDLYDLAAYSGRRQASYLFDYFMNNYISLHMNGQRPMGYLRYDPRDRSFYFTDDERFEILDR
jgi:hypothetical protein